MKKLKWIIITLILIIVILSVILLLNLQKNSQKINMPNKDNELTSVIDNNNEEVSKSANELGIIPNNNTNKEIGYVEMFTISNCISEYLDTINRNNTKYYSVDTDGNKISIVSEEKINENIKALESVKSNNNVQMLNEKNIFTLINASKLIDGEVESYAVYGFTVNLNNEYLKDMYFIVNLDTINSTFSIEELNGNYSNLDEINAEKIESIEKNKYNTFSYQSINEQFKYKKIFLNYKRIILAKPELAYQYLDDDYKKERFENYENFYNYIQENRDIIKDMIAKKYKVDDDNSNIIITDQNENKMTFNIKSSMQYTVKVDNYIILNDDDIKKYNKLNDDKKAKYCIDRWLKMIYHRDYKYAYKFLDETYKNDKYGSEEQFEEFIKNKYPYKYNYSILNFEENGNVYTAEIELTTDEEFTEKYMTIIIKLESDANFSLSFDVQ